MMALITTWPWEQHSQTLSLNCPICDKTFPSKRQVDLLKTMLCHTLQVPSLLIYIQLDFLYSRTFASSMSYDLRSCLTSVIRKLLLVLLPYRKYVYYLKYSVKGCLLPSCGLLPLSHTTQLCQPLT